MALEEFCGVFIRPAFQGFVDSLFNSCDEIVAAFFNWIKYHTRVLLSFVIFLAHFTVKRFVIMF